MLTRNISLFLACIILTVFTAFLQAAADTEANKAVVQRWVDLWNTGDLSIADEIFADDYVSHVPQHPHLTDRESYKAQVIGNRTDIPDLHVTVEDMAAEDDKVATRFTITGTPQAAGVQYTNTTIAIFHFADGKIVEEWFYHDMLGVLEQLGAMPPTREDYTWGVPSEVTGDPGDPEANKALVLREYEAWNQGDPDAMLTLLDEIYAANFVNHMPTHPHVTDLASYKKWVAEDNFASFPDLQCPVEDIIAEGDRVVVRWTWMGTHIAFGKQVAAPGITIYRIADGRIVEAWWAFDMLGVVQQMGAMAELEANKALVERVVELENTGNLAIADEIFATDFVKHDPSLPEVTGLESLKAFIVVSRTATPDQHIVVEDMVAEGDKVVARVTVTGTHTGEFMGIPPSGAQVTNTRIHIYRFAGGKIVESWANFDMLGVLQQIGVMPPTREDYTWGVPSEVTGDPGHPATNKAIVQRMLDEVLKGNLAVVDELFATDYVTHDPTSPMEVRGPEGFKQWLSSMSEPYFSDGHIAVEDMIAEGDKVVVRWVWSGTHKGEFMGIPATGRRITLTGICIHRFADGKFVERWISYDAMGMMQQLTMSQEEANKAVVLRAAELWNTGSLIVADEIFAADFVNHDPNPPGVTDLESYKGWVVEWRAAFPDYHVEVHDMIAEGDKVGARYTVTGTHQGDFFGVPATGIPVTMKMISIYRLADGKIAEAQWSYDLLGVGQQIGYYQPIPDFPYSFARRTNPEDFPWGEPSAVTGDPGDPETNKALIVHETVDGWNQGDVAVAIEVFAPTFVWHSAYPEVVSYESYVQWVEGHIDPDDPTILTIEDMLAEGDKAIEYSTAQGGTLTGMSVSRFADGKIVERWRNLNILPAFIAMGILPPLPGPTPEGYDNVFFMSLSPGLNMISVPLEPVTPYTARSFAEEIGATMVIRYDTTLRKFMGFTPVASDDGFNIEGGEGYIVNVPEGGTVAFTGAAWTNEPPVAAPSDQHAGRMPALPSAWAFVVSGSVLDGEGMSASDGEYTAIVKNLRTGEILTEAVDTTGYFAAASADLSRKAIISAGDQVEVAVMDSSGKVVSGPFIHDIKLDEIRNAVANLHLKLGDIIPAKPALLQNYPNPFNPETWIPYHLRDANPVVIRIHNASGQLVRTLDLGYRNAGIYASRSRAAYWDGRNEAGEEIASGLYFYSITAGDFSATRKMVMKK